MPQVGTEVPQTTPHYQCLYTIGTQWQNHLQKNLQDKVFGDSSARQTSFFPIQNIQLGRQGKKTTRMRQRSLGLQVQLIPFRKLRHIYGVNFDLRLIYKRVDGSMASLYQFGWRCWVGGRAICVICICCYVCSVLDVRL